MIKYIIAIVIASIVISRLIEFKVKDTSVWFACGAAYGAILAIL